MLTGLNLPGPSQHADLQRTFARGGSLELRALFNDPSRVFEPHSTAPEDVLVQTLDAGLLDFVSHVATVDHIRACRGELRVLSAEDPVALWPSTKGEFRPMGLALNLSENTRIEFAFKRVADLQILHTVTLDPGDACVVKTPPGLQCHACSTGSGFAFFGWFLRLAPWSGVAPSSQNLKVPWRSAYSILDGLAGYLEGRTVFEIGCACGDTMVYTQERFGARVRGLELDEQRVRLARDKGLDVVHGDVLTMQIPEADTYYMWLGDYALERQIVERISQGTLLIGQATDAAPWEPYVYEMRVELNALHRHLRHLPNAKVVEIPFNEGVGWREAGICSVIVLER